MLNVVAMKKALIVIIGVAIIVVVIIKLKDKDLHRGQINGRIDKYYCFVDKEYNKLCTIITVNAIEYKMIVTPVAGNEFEFRDVARIGDKVFKSANNDTLMIVRSGYDDISFPYIVKPIGSN